MSEKLLELKNITMKFGGVTALSEVNLHEDEELAYLGGLQQPLIKRYQ